MSHVTCHKFGNNEHMIGYGLAYGPIGSYTACECGELLEFSPDLEGVEESEAKQIIANIQKWRDSVQPEETPQTRE